MGLQFLGAGLDSGGCRRLDGGSGLGGTRSADGFARAGDRRREAIAKANAGDALLEMGRLVEARELLAAAVEGSRRVGNDRTVAVASANLASLERMAGAAEQVGAAE